MKKMRWLAMLLALVMVAAACGSDEAEDTGTADGDTEESTDEGTDEGTDDTDEVDVTQGTDLTFHMITHSDNGPFWTVLQNGAEAAAEAMGINLVWLASDNDPAVQAQQIDQAIAEERAAVLRCGGTKDQAEGMRAFLEKRRPVFTGE